MILFLDTSAPGFIRKPAYKMQAVMNAFVEGSFEDCFVGERRNDGTMALGIASPLILNPLPMCEPLHGFTRIRELLRSSHALRRNATR